ncbi:MAG: hypothetical protein R3E86_19085 [Pseudomonadales bacterium]
MRRLYFVADDLEIVEQVSAALRAAGISSWNFHVLSRDEAGLYRHSIHSAATYHQLDIIHTGERWGLVGGCIGLGAGLIAYFGELLPWNVNLLTVLLMTLVGALYGAWQGGMVGMTRENYKIAPFHGDIEAGRHLIMVDVNDRNRAQVREIMNMRFPQVSFGGRDSPMISPFARPERVYHQSTH